MNDVGKPCAGDPCDLPVQVDRIRFAEQLEFERRQSRAVIPVRFRRRSSARTRSRRVRHRGLRPSVRGATQLAAGVRHAEVDAELAQANTLTQVASLGLFGDADRRSDVLPNMHRMARRFAEAYQGGEQGRPRAVLR